MQNFNSRHGNHKQFIGLSVEKNIFLQLGSFPFVPPTKLCTAQLQNTCHYIVNHHVKVWHVHLRGANNMHPLSWGAQVEKILQIYQILTLAAKRDIKKLPLINEIGHWSRRKPNIACFKNDF